MTKGSTETIATKRAAMCVRLNGPARERGRENCVADDVRACFAPLIHARLRFKTWRDIAIDMYGDARKAVAVSAAYHREAVKRQAPANTTKYATDADTAMTATETGPAEPADAEVSAGRDTSRAAPVASTAEPDRCDIDASDQATSVDIRANAVGPARGAADTVTTMHPGLFDTMSDARDEDRIGASATGAGR